MYDEGEWRCWETNVWCAPEQVEHFGARRRDHEGKEQREQSQSQEPLHSPPFGRHSQPAITNATV